MQNNFLLNSNPSTILEYPFEGNLLDKSKNALALNNVGGVGFIKKPNMPAGILSVGGFSDAKYLQGDSNVLKVISNKTMYCIEFFFNFTSIGGSDNIMFSVTQNGTGTTDVVYVDWVQSLTTFIWGKGAGLSNAVQSTGFTPLVGVWYYCGLSWDGTTRRLYLSPANNISRIPNATKVQSASIQIADQFFIGRYTGVGSSFNGTIKNFRFSSDPTPTFFS